MHHTIYALSTVYGKSAIAIFRISGKEAASTFDIFKLNQPKPKTPALVKIFDGNTLVDEALSIYFQKPNSFTGEDLVEIQCHGSLAVIKHISDQLSKKFLLAEPGEFTQRAFFNNKLDLTKAEGIIDLINAETKEQIKQTSRQFLGQLKDEYDCLRKSIIKAASYLEAYMDFPDEDITNVDIDKIKSLIEPVSKKISFYIKDNYVGEKIKKGFEVAIIGPPNSGKSTLFNYFAKKDYAIVTNIPGTTRDTLELKLDLNGYPVVIADTAGIHTTSDIIEKEGIKKAVKFAQNADITIVMHDIKELVENEVDAQNINHGTNFIYVASKADNIKQLTQIFNDKNLPQCTIFPVNFRFLTKFQSILFYFHRGCQI